MNKKSFYNLAQWTWGLPQTLAGLAVYMMHRKDKHFDYEGARITVWDRNDGLSLGKYIFVPDEESLTAHEYGHSRQSLILGPLYLPVVGLSSMIWNRLPFFKSFRKKTGKSYESFIIESSATYLGRRGKSAKRKQ